MEGCGGKNSALALANKFINDVAMVQWSHVLGACGLTLKACSQELQKGAAVGTTGMCWLHVTVDTS